MASLNPKYILLIDATGALISSLIIGLGAFCFSDILGMPKKVLTILSIIPIFYFIYSLTCYFREYQSQKLSHQLKIIALANLTYCVLTTFLLFYNLPKITTLEFVYFTLEIIIITTLSFIELKFTKKIK